LPHSSSALARPAASCRFRDTRPAEGCSGHRVVGYNAAPRLRRRSNLKHMIAVDYIILAILILSAVMGLIRGLLREAVAVITWFLAIVLAWYFGSSIEPYLGGVLVGSPLRIWAARAIIFVLVLLLGSAVGVLLGHFVRVSMFAGMDKFLGFVFGLVRGVVIVGAFTIAIQALSMDQDPKWKNSKLLPYAIGVADALRGIVGDKLERLQLPQKAVST
jgi:membrane protein required for colicin V production